MRPLLLTLLALAACKSPVPTPSDVDSSAWIAPRVDAAPVDARLALLEAWNAALVAHDTGTLGRLYAERVAFYGVTLPGAGCVDRVSHLFATNPDFTQSVIVASPAEAIEVSDASADARITFTKRVTTHGKTTDYPAYLVVRAIAGAFRIVEESDAVTDANLAARAPSYGDDCHTAIGAALDEIWAARVGGFGLQSDGWTECGGRQCVTRYAMPAVPGGFAHRLVSFSVDFETGALTSTGGWLVEPEGERIPVAPEVEERIRKACRGGRIRVDKN